VDVDSKVKVFILIAFTLCKLLNKPILTLTAIKKKKGVVMCVYMSLQAQSLIF